MQLMGHLWHGWVVEKVAVKCNQYLCLMDNVMTVLNAKARYQNIVIRIIQKCKCHESMAL